MHFPRIMPPGARPGRPAVEADAAAGSTAAPAARGPAPSSGVDCKWPLPGRATPAAQAQRPRTAWSGALRAAGAALHLARPADPAGQGAALSPAKGLRASAKPPIDTLAPAEFARALKSFRESLRGWIVVGAHNPHAAPEDAHQRAWRMRTQNIGTALASIEPDATNIAYRFEGRPVGLMSCTRPRGREGRREKTPLQIHALATHPGSIGVGGALIEHAVNLAQQDGAKGVVRLNALESALGSYEAMGFTESSPGRMELDPRTSDKWTRLKGKWLLAKHAGAPYADALPDAAAVSGADLRPTPSAR